MTGIGRQLYWVNFESGSSGNPDDPDTEDRKRVEKLKDANCVSSQIGYSDKHAPALDIDLPCRLIESTTPGHFHLYIDVEMEWKEYEALLEVLADVGIIEHGYRDASLRRKATFLRLPGVKKDIIPEPEVF